MHHNPKFLALALLCLALGNTSTDAVTTSPSNGPALSVQTNKKDYVIGEPVQVRIGLINVSLYESVSEYEKHSPTLKITGVSPDFLILAKSLCLYDAPGNAAFKYCAQAQPAKEPAPQVTISNQPREYIAQFQEYASGSYHLKVAIRRTTEEFYPQTSDLLVSGPIEITLHEPTGIDAQVWQQLRDNPEFLSFYKSGQFPSWRYGTPEATAALQKLSKLANDQPSVYSEGIRNRVANYRPLPVE